LTRRSGDDTFPGMTDTRVCHTCPERHTCTAICEDVEAILPSMEAGRLDQEDLLRLWRGMMFTRAILDHEDVLTEKQREVIRFYYREQKEQKEIAALLNVSQQAVNDALERACKKIGDFLKATQKTTS
jgi:DNA-binding CsgD family transcriptional regulator